MNANDNVVGFIFHESAVTEEIREFQEQRNGSVRMVAVLQETDLPNRNRRVYPKDVITEALKTPYVTERLSRRSLFGEAGHPQNPSMQRQLLVELTNVSHIIHEMWWDPQNPKLLLGRLESADTNVGRDFAGLVKQGMQASFSMRGMGDVISENGYMKVKSPLKLVTYDFVNFPSHEKAYMRSLCESQIPVNVGEVARYAAANSENFKALNEQVLNLFAEKLDFQFDAGNTRLTVIDRQTGRPAASVLMEAKLRREVDDALKSLF